MGEGEGQGEEEGQGEGEEREREERREERREIEEGDRGRERCYFPPVWVPVIYPEISLRRFRINSRLCDHRS